MKLSSFKVGEYAVDTDGEVVKILDKGSRTAKGELEIIKSVSSSRPIGYVGQFRFSDYGNGTRANGWKSWAHSAKVAGNPLILAKIQETKKNLEDLEKAYNDSLKPKIELIVGMPYDVDGNIGVLKDIDRDGDLWFVFGDSTEYYTKTELDGFTVKALTNPNQIQAAKIIYDFLKDGKFPEN